MSSENSVSLHSHIEAKFRKNLLIVGIVFAVLAGANTGVVNAQGARKGFGIEEIIVTSQKRTENLQDVPIAVSAFTNDAMKVKGMTNVSQLGDFTPNVEIDTTSSFSGSTQVLAAYIRGIGQNDFAFNLDPGVGVYVDGVYYARTVGAVLDLLDLERIEVLKGPQGTLFGRNTIGGAINIITRKPAEEFQAQGEVTIGQYDRTDFRGAVDIPLIQGKLYSQLAFSSKNRDGYHKYRDWTADGVFQSNTDSLVRVVNTEYDEAGGENTDNIRAKLDWLVSDTVNATFGVDYSRVDEQPTPSQLLGLTPPPPGGNLINAYNACISTTDPNMAPPFCNLPIENAGNTLLGVNADSDPGNDFLPFDERFVVDGARDFSYSTGAGYSKVEAQGISATVDWDVNDDLMLKSITAYRDLDSAFGVDVEGTPVAIGNHAFTMTQEQFSQEFQLTGISFENKMDWLLGAYYFHEEGNLTDYVHFAEGLLQILGPNDFDTDAYALFSNVDYALTGNIGLTAGIRYTEEDKEFVGSQRDLNSLAFKAGFPLNLHPDPTDTTLYFPGGVNQQDFDNISIRLGAQYRFDNGNMIYASYSEGYKSGGWTTRATVPIQTAPAFDEETAETIEIGLKGRFLEDKLQVNIALFTTDYNDLQVTVQEGVSPVTENAADSKIDGIEVEILALLSEQFSLTTNVGYLDARYTDLDSGTDLTKDFLFVNTPELSTSVSADWIIPLSSFGEVLLHADYSYKDEQANEGENQPLLISDSASLVNAVIRYTNPVEKWKFSLGVRNLTDERYLVAGQNQPGIGYVGGTYNRPREWYATLGFNF